MIALFIGGGAGGANLMQVAADALAGPVRHLRLVQRQQIATGANGMQTVAEFCAARGAELTITDLNRIGRKAAALSRAAGAQIGKAPCPLFGEVNTYSPALLAQAIDQITAVAA